MLRSQVSIKADKDAHDAAAAAAAAAVAAARRHELRSVPCTLRYYFSKRDDVRHVDSAHERIITHCRAIVNLSVAPLVAQVSVHVQKLLLSGSNASELPPNPSMALGAVRLPVLAPALG